MTYRVKETDVNKFLWQYPSAKFLHWELVTIMKVGNTAIKVKIYYFHVDK